MELPINSKQTLQLKYSNVKQHLYLESSIALILPPKAILPILFFYILKSYVKEIFPGAPATSRTYLGTP